MSQLPDRPIRRTVDFDQDLFDFIEDMMKKRKWSFSYTCYVLLQQAVKEKNRKKVTATKEVHT